MPPEYLTGLLHSIEETIVTFYEEFPILADEDVEWVYDRLSKYYKTIASGKNIEEPESSIERRQDLMDEILNRIDLREELKADIDFINNPEIRHGERMIPSLAFMYVVAFKKLKDSARFWRKKDGKRGYLNYVSNFVY